MLIAVDTNIMIRLAMRDDDIQYQKVMNLLIENQFFISTLPFSMESVEIVKGLPKLEEKK